MSFSRTVKTGAGLAGGPPMSSKDHRTPGCKHVGRIYRIEHGPRGPWELVYCMRCHPNQVKL